VRGLSGAKKTRRLQPFWRLAMLIRMSDKPFGLLELGTNSLKHWRVEFVPGEG